MTYSAAMLWVTRLEVPRRGLEEESMSPKAESGAGALRWWGRVLTALLIAISAGGFATAQDKPAADDAQVFDFEEDELSTDYLKPQTMMVEGLQRGRMSSLISVRLHFVDEIVKSAEDI